MFVAMGVGHGYRDGLELLEEMFVNLAEFRDTAGVPERVLIFHGWRVDVAEGVEFARQQATEKTGHGRHRIWAVQSHELFNHDSGGLIPAIFFVVWRS